MKLDNYILPFLLFLGGCQSPSSRSLPYELIPVSALENILTNGEIEVSTQYTTTSFFIDKDGGKGFSYKMVDAFSKSLQVNYNFSTINNSIYQGLADLQDRTYDLYAADIPAYLKHPFNVRYTIPLFYTDYVLVRHKDASPLKSLFDLDGKRVKVQNKSYSSQLLRQLCDSLHISVYLSETCDEQTEEDIIYSVNKGIDEYTLVESHIANAFLTSLPNLRISATVARHVPIVWAVDAYSDDLLHYLNTWINNYRHSGKLASIFYSNFSKYRKDANFVSCYKRLKQGKISHYDNIIKKESSRIGWDWQLLASLIHVESGFNAIAVSSKSAFGLMQLMESTAAEFKGLNYLLPEDNIRIGVRYLRTISRYFNDSSIDSLQKVKFILAAYNVGVGHVQDAQRLALKYGYNPNVYDQNVDYFLKSKSEPAYYSDPVARYGYCDGTQVFKYVNKVITTYHLFRHVKD